MNKFDIAKPWSNARVDHGESEDGEARTVSPDSPHLSDERAVTIYVSVRVHSVIAEYVFHCVGWDSDIMRRRQKR